ncbi:hypothetical protein TNCV_2694451 [Trichonephila clavipes]|nr:hypothetical protein TNCV_2694451 [Trichonephila clavipes]
MKRNLIDGYIREFRKRGANGHRLKRSVRKNSWFEEKAVKEIYRPLEELSGNAVWCQRWDFMPITRAMDEKLKALLEGINAFKNGQKETKERMENMQRS